MKRNLILPLMSVLAIVIAMPALGQNANTLTDEEKTEGWVLLFNGSDFSGWRQCNGSEMPKNWILEDDAMKVYTGEGKKPGQGANGDILYGDQKFKNFELSIDWKASDMANSGIFYNIRELPGKPIYYAAPEIQVLDNVNATDNKNPTHLAGSLYDMIACPDEYIKPAGEWNICVLEVNHNTNLAKVSMNGTQVITFPVHGENNRVRGGRSCP